MSFRLAVLLPGLALAGIMLKSPAWLSIESPVNPYDQATRGAALLVHAKFPSGNPKVADLTGSAEGLVNGARRSLPLRFDSTTHLDVFALRRQWPSDGTWLLRISLRETTALVLLDASGNVASARVPTRPGGEIPLPRAVTMGEVDSILTAVAKR